MDKKVIIKRDGKKALFDIQKIRNQIIPACAGTSINYLELEAQLALGKIKNLKTSDIQEKLILTAKNNVSVDNPDWDLVAGRLASYNLYRKIYKATKLEVIDYAEHIKYLIRNNHYRKDILSMVTKEELATLSTYIKQERDYNLLISQIMLLESKYLIKTKTKFIEYPSTADMTNGLILASLEKDKTKYTKTFYDMLSKYYLSLATPFKSNLRRPHGNTGSCYIGEGADNLYSIFKSYTDMALISKEGGGIGWYWGKIRPGDTYTPGVPKSNKINKWIKIVNDIAVAVNQRGIRKGAITPALDWWHMDIIDFCEIKSELSGDLRDKAFDVFPQVVVDAYFIDAVLEDKEIYLFNQYEYHKLTNIDVTELVDEALYATHAQIKELIETGKLKHYEKIKAKDLWKKFLKTWIEYGDFYITHKDNINRANYVKGIGITKCTNLCVSGKTKILTKKYGYIDIEKVSDMTLEVWNGTQWSMTKLFKTHENDKLLTIKLSNGQTIHATDYHRWEVITGYKKTGRGKIYSTPAKIKTTKELQVGDKLSKFLLPIVPHGNKELYLAYENGFYTGDGCAGKRGIGRVYLYGKKRLLLEKFKGYTAYHEDDEQDRTVLSFGNRNLKDKFFIPSIEYKLSARLKWLAGLLDSDGTLTNNNGAEAIQLSSINVAFLNNILLSLQEMGIQSKVTLMRDSGYYELPLNDKSGNNGKFLCKTVYRLIIAGSETQKLLNLGFKAYRVMPTERKYNREAMHFIKIVSVTDDKINEATYCGNEPINHKLMFNGVMTMNCVESFSISKPATKWKIEGSSNGQITTESNGFTHSCNLISVNVANILNDDKLLKKVCYSAVRMLDNSIDLGTAPIYEAEKTSKALRNIGIGIVGMADYMAYNKVLYDTEDGRRVGEKLAEKIAYYCYSASIELAEEKGAYPLFDKNNYNKLFGEDPTKLNEYSLENGNSFDWIKLVNKIREKGIRNFYLLAYAPNTSSGLMQGVTPSYLPAYNKFNTQKLGDMIVPVLPKFIKSRYWFYKTKFQYKPSDIIKYTRILQRWVDTGISMEININPVLTSIKEISDAILEGFKTKELKAVYYSLTINPDKPNNDEPAICTDCAN